MVEFSISRILFINGVYSVPLFLMYQLSQSTYFTFLITSFIITYSIELYFQRFGTKLLHLIVFLLVFLFMMSYLYEKMKVIEYSEYFIILTTLAIGIYYLVSILKLDNNYTFNKGYLLFTGVSFLYFSSIPGLSDTI